MFNGPGTTRKSPIDILNDRAIQNGTTARLQPGIPITRDDRVFNDPGAVVYAV